MNTQDQELASLNARYRSLLDGIPAMMHSIDAAGNLVAVSQKWLDVLGYSRPQVIGRKSTEFLTEGSRRYAEETVLPAFFRTGECRDVPYQFVASDGRILDVLLSANGERDAQGEIVRSISVMQDVTELRQAGLQLRAASEYAENLLHTANVMVVELDTDGNVRRLNPMAEQVTGYALAEIRGGNWFQILVPRARYPKVWQEFERLVHDASGRGEFENPILTKTGAEKQISWRNSPLVENGKVLGTLSIGIDVTGQRKLERLLKLSEAALKEAQSVAHIGSWILDHQTGDLIWSDEVFRILEIDRETVGASKDAFLSRLHPDDREEVKKAYRVSRTYKRAYEIRHRLLLPDGTIKYVHQRSETIAEGSERARSLGTIQDVTLAVLQEMAYQESEERFRTIADYTYDWEYWEGADREILYISPSCLRVTGYTQAEFISDPRLIERIVHPEDRPVFEQHLQDVRQDPRQEVGSQLNFRIVRKDGEVRWIAHGCRAVMTGEGTSRGRRVSNRDISDLKHAEELASRLAHFDTLTGLPNRRMLHDRLLVALGQARRHQRPLAVMFLDLDRFKQINDTLGHDVGDQLLIEVGKRLSACVRLCDTVARAGGDEFIIVLPEIAAPGDACLVAEKIIGVLRQPMRLGGQDFKTTASIGIGLRSGDDADDASELMKKADIAMYQAKLAGRNGYRLYAAAPSPA
ncbi:MAG: diguanylate cyclase [Azonexus sp.]